jgi:hypothetical protein
VPGSLSQTFSFVDGVELSDGDRLGVVAVQVGGGGDKDTSELSFSSLSDKLDGTPPKVTNVVLSNSNTSDERPYFEQVNVLNDMEGDQIRALPFEGADTIKITFSEPVHTMGNELTVQSIRDETAYPLLAGGYDSGTNTYTWTLQSGALDSADQVLLILRDTITADSNGEALDGEWINPAHVTTNVDAHLISEFPSGDGTPGGEFRFVFTTHFLGDFDNDNLIAQGDLDAVLFNWAELITQDLLEVFIGGLADSTGHIDQEELDAVLQNWADSLQELFLYGDFNGDSVVDEADFYLAYDNYEQAESLVAEFADEVWSDADDIIGQWELLGVIQHWGLWFATNVNPNPV